MKKLLRIISNALFPRSCVGCGKDGEDFCLPCRTWLPPPSDQAFRAEWLISAWSYRDPKVRNAIRALKYRGKIPLAKIFAEALHDKLLEELAEKEMFWGEMHPTPALPSKEVRGLTTLILIPIPLSKPRMHKRGFNQSELIAKHLAKISGEIFELSCNVLERIKNTEHQTLLKNRDERLRNLQGSFVVKNPESIRGKIIILIDDVATTGATLLEARRVLLDAGAKRVYGATVAH